MPTPHNPPSPQNSFNNTQGLVQSRQHEETQQILRTLVACAAVETQVQVAHRPPGEGRIFPGPQALPRHLLGGL